MKVIIVESILLVIAMLLFLWKNGGVFFLLYYLLMLLITITVAFFCIKRNWKKLFSLLLSVYLVHITFYAFGIRFPPRLMKIINDYHSQSISESKSIQCFISEYKLLHDSLPAYCSLSFSEVFTEWRHYYGDSYSKDFYRDYDIACFSAKINNIADIRKKGLGKNWAIANYNIKGMVETCTDDSTISFYVHNDDTISFDIINIVTHKPIGHIFFCKDH